MAEKPKLGEMLRMMGAGGARNAGKAVVDTQKKKKKKLDSVMDEIRKTRGR